MAGKYHDYLPVIFAALVFLVIGAICFFSSQRALERSQKKLSWIKRHENGGFPFAREAFPSKKPDWLGVFGVAVFALVVSMAASAVESDLQGKDWLSGLFSSHSLTAILISVCGTAALYLLLQLLFGSTVISASVSLLFASSLVGAHTAAAMLCVALLLLVLWVTSEQTKLLPTELLYGAACLTLCAAIALRPQLMPLLLLFVGLHLYKHIWRLRADEERPQIFLWALLLGLLFWLLGAFLYVFGRIFFNFGAIVAAIWPRYAADPFGITGRMLKSGLRQIARPLMRSRLLLPMMDAPLLGIGGFGMISALLLWLRRKDPRGLLTLGPALFTVLIWLLNDTSVLSAGLSLTAALLYANYERGGKRWPIAATAALGVAFNLALYFFGAYLPLCDGLLYRLA